MKNKFLTIISTTIFLFISEQILFAKNLNIKSSTISIDKKKNESLFKGNVIATDLMNNILEADEAQYNKKK
jgi:lipopolysaccharide export system protein LptA